MKYSIFNINIQYLIFNGAKMRKYAEKYAICGFLENMRSHDRYKPVSLKCMSPHVCM